VLPTSHSGENPSQPRKSLADERKHPLHTVWGYLDSNVKSAYYGRMKNRLPVLGLLGVFSSTLACSYALAQNDPCAQLKSTAEQSQCVNRQLKSAEHDLKIALDAAIRYYTESEVKNNEKQSLPKTEQDAQIRWEKAMVGKLRTSQQAWLKYRESACGTVGLMYDGGTFASVAVPLCKADLTRERTKFLQGYFAEDR
jgi:uncharacterized protein YecT (DUF1311 family)